MLYVMYKSRIVCFFDTINGRSHSQIGFLKQKTLVFKIINIFKILAISNFFDKDKLIT